MVISTIWPPPTSHPASSWISHLRLIPFVTLAVGHRPDETSPVPSPAFTSSRSPYAGGSFKAVFPGSSPLPWPSLLAHKLGSLFLPFGLTFRRCKIHFMLRAVVSLSFLRRIQRFGTLMCTGCLLPGRLFVTRTGLSPASRR